MRGVRFVLSEDPGIEVVGEAQNGRSAVQEELQPDVAIMDIAMPQMNGIEATGLIAK